MATNKHFHVKHGLTAGTGVATQVGSPPVPGPATREVITNTGELVDVGNLTNLTTPVKTNIVSAINSLAAGNATVDDVIALAIALG
jgi:uncharacterized protein (DUF111 family)